MQKKITNNSIAAVCKQLELAKNVAVFCHIRPDGDALGAVLALTTALNNAGKCAVAFCDDVVPEKYDFLNKTLEVKDKLPESVKFDTFICVDCSDVTRIGAFCDAFVAFKGRKINIDHHVSNTRYADCNYIAERTATCELLTEILTVAGYEIDNEIANFLMLGLITDSGNFTHSDVTDKTFEIAALLRKKGADVTLINYRMFSRQTKLRALLFAKAVNSMRFALDDRLAFVIIGFDIADKPDFDKSVTEGFADFPLTIDGVEVSASLLEVKKCLYKISLRSKGKANVNAVASAFGGGGHVLASGCMLAGELEEVIEKITYAVYQNL